VIADSTTFALELFKCGLMQAITFYLLSLKTNWAQESLNKFAIHLKESIFAGSPASLFSRIAIMLNRLDTPSSNFL
jgi:hypothetical protein